MADVQKQITKQKLEFFKQAFIPFDRDSTGFISYSDLKTVMTTLGDPMSNQEWQSLKEEGIVKVEPDGSVNYEQFLVNLTEELGKDMDDGAGQSRGLPDGASS